MPNIDPVDARVDDPVLNPIFDRFRERGREVPLLYRLLANAPPMLEAWVGLAWPLRTEASTPRALRELIIMRVAVCTRASFEWQAHWPAALDAGVTVAQLSDLGDWRGSDEFDDEERVVLAAVDEIVADGGASPAAMEALRTHFDDGECVELVLTASFYVCVSRTLASLGVEADVEGTTDGEDLLGVFARQVSAATGS